MGTSGVSIGFAALAFSVAVKDGSFWPRAGVSRSFVYLRTAEHEHQVRTMAARNKLTKVDRVITLALAVVWFGVGLVGLVLGLIHRRPILVALAVLAMWCGIIWLRVAALARKLASWREFITPWRNQ